MDPLDKLELIVKGTLKKKKTEYERWKDKQNFFDAIKKISHALELVNLQYTRLKASVLDP